MRREERRRDKTEDAIKQPIAAPAWPRYATRPPLRYLCVLPAVRAAGGGFRCRATAHLPICHRPWYDRQGSRHKFLAVQPRMSHAVYMLMLLVLCGGWNFDAVSMREKTQDGRNIPPAQYPGMSHSTVEPYLCTARGCSVPSSGEKHVLGYAAHTQNAF